MSAERRIKVADDVLALLAIHQCQVVHSSIRKSALTKVGPTATDRADPHLLAFQFVIEKAEEWLEEQTDPLRQRALIVADETTEHDAYCIRMVNSMQRGEGGLVRGSQRADIAPLAHIVDTAHFVKSQDSRGIQLADLVAYLLNVHSRGGSGKSAEATARMVRQRIHPQRATWRKTWPAGNP